MNTTVASEPPPVTRHNADVATAQLSYLACGPEQGEVVVCLHGVPASAELWRGVLERLGAAGYRALAPDLPGYGRTRLPANGDRSLAGAAQLVTTWVTGTGLGPVWLVGHDLGGGVAQIVATRHAEAVSRLTLTNCPSRDNWPVPPIARSRALARLGLLRPLGAARIVVNPYTNWELRRVFADPSRLTHADRRRVFWDEKVSDARGRMEFSEHLKSLDNAQTAAVFDDLGKVAVPVQLVWAMQDPHLPWAPEGEALRDAFDAGREPADAVRVDLLEDAGHFVPLERSASFVEAMRGWREGPAEVPAAP